MIKKRFIVFFFLPCCFYFVTAQQPTIKLSESWKSKNATLSTFSNAANDIITLEMAEENKGYVPTLTLYDSSLKIMHTWKFTAPTEGTTYVQTIQTTNYLSILSKKVNKEAKTATYYLQKVNSTSLQSDGETITLTVVPLSEKGPEPVIDVRVSPDDSKFLFSYYFDKGAGNRKLAMQVYNNRMEKEWENTADLGYPLLHSSVYFLAINNNGEVAVETSHFSEALDKRKAGDIELPTHVHEVFVFSETHTQAEMIPFTIDDTYGNNYHIRWTNDGMLELFGMYRIRWNGNITGVFLLTIDPVRKSVLQKELTPFPATLLEKMRPSNESKIEKKDPGIEGYYALFEVMERPEGVNYILQSNYSVVVGEVYNVWSYINTTTERGGIINFFVKTDHSSVFSYLPMLQKEYNHISLCGFKSLPYKDALLIFYNESDLNLKHSLDRKNLMVEDFRSTNLTMAVMKDNGEVSRSSIFKYDSKKTPIIRPGESRIGSSKQLVLYASTLGSLFSDFSEKQIGKLIIN